MKKKPDSLKNPVPYHQKTQLHVGDTVIHRLFGAGTIVSRWGSWSFCRECNYDLSAPDFSECPCCGHYEKTKKIKDLIQLRYYWRCLGCSSEVDPPHHARCPQCNRITIVLSVNGREIFDVRFQREIISVHQCWIKKIK